MTIGEMLVLLVPLVAGGVAQSLAIARNPFPKLAVPIDGDRTFGGRSILGPNKTWRGVFIMTLTTALAAAVLYPLAPPFEPPPAIGWTTLGAAMGLGYVLGELPNSFVKRRLGIGAGEHGARLHRVQYLIDQVDSVVGVAIALWWLTDIEPEELAAVALLGSLVHVGFDRALRTLGVKDRAYGADRRR